VELASKEVSISALPKTRKVSHAAKILTALKHLILFTTALSPSQTRSKPKVSAPSSLKAVVPLTQPLTSSV